MFCDYLLDLMYGSCFLGWFSRAAVDDSRRRISRCEYMLLYHCLERNLEMASWPFLFPTLIHRSDSIRKRQTGVGN